MPSVTPSTEFQFQIEIDAGFTLGIMLRLDEDIVTEIILQLNAPLGCVSHGCRVCHLRSFAELFSEHDP